MDDNFRDRLNEIEKIQERTWKRMEEDRKREQEYRKRIREQIQRDRELQQNLANQFAELEKQHQRNQQIVDEIKKNWN